MKVESFIQSMWNFSLNFFIIESESFCTADFQTKKKFIEFVPVAANRRSEIFELVECRQTHSWGRTNSKKFEFRRPFSVLRKCQHFRWIRASWIWKFDRKSLEFQILSELIFNRVDEMLTASELRCKWIHAVDICEIY